MIDLIPGLTTHQREEVYRYIELKCDNKKELSPPNLIPFKSNIYDLNEDKFIEYSPQYVFINKIPYDYNTNAVQQSSVDSLMEKIADNDKDILILLYEVIGYCFYRCCTYRGAVILYGPKGNNGKTTLLNLIRKLIGEENISCLSLQDTTEKFRIGELYGKLANIGDDIPSNHISDSSLFKKLTSGVEITAEEKFKKPFTFINVAKMFFASNELPRVNDKTKAFISRIILIPLKHDFVNDHDYDPFLKDRNWSCEELGYLLKHAMDGLKRLIKQGNFTKPKAVLEEINEYENLNNPVKAFLEDYGDIEGKSTDDVYSAYKAWCDDGNYKTLAKQIFSRDVCNLIGLKSVPERINGKLKRCYKKVLLHKRVTR